MGIKAVPARSTLSDALNQATGASTMNWRSGPLLSARALYAKESSVLDLDASVYALDATTIDRCLSLFGWAPARTR